jgi:hypothetical protein
MSNEVIQHNDAAAMTLEQLIERCTRELYSALALLETVEGALVHALPQRRISGNLAQQIQLADHAFQTISATAAALTSASQQCASEWTVEIERVVEHVSLADVAARLRGVDSLDEVEKRDDHHFF